MDGPDPPAIRHWPPHEDLDPATALAARCGACGTEWRIHPDLGGFRLRCGCGAYVQAPAVSRPALPYGEFDEVGAGTARLPVPRLARDDQGRLELPVRAGETIERDLPVSVPMAPGTVQHANVATRQRWTNAAFLELGLLMAAFLLPALLTGFLLDGDARTLAMPFASLATGVAVIVIAAALSPFAFTGMRGARVRFFAEAVLVAAVFFGLAMLWVDLIDAEDESGAMLRGLRESLGTGWFLFVLAFTPAVFEEIAFRGAVQGRFSALLGRFPGLVATGTAFGVCHGITAALPFHVGIGIYLCFLRERSRSLLPGMLAHGLYNAAIGLSA